jgi:hypothetical protein
VLVEDVCDDELDGLTSLAATAAAGTSPPGGPEFRRRQLSAVRQELRIEKPLCAALDGFTLHAATRAGGCDAEGRERLCKYILRPAIAQERIGEGPEGLVRITLKRAFSDGATAIDMDPLSLMVRLAGSVPPPKMHLTRYCGVLAAASKLRSRIVPRRAATANEEEPSAKKKGCGGSHYRDWAELLARTFSVDVLACDCGGRLKLIAMVTETNNITRYLRGTGEPTELPERAPARGQPHWASKVLRRSVA